MKKKRSFDDCSSPLPPDHDSSLTLTEGFTNNNSTTTPNCTTTNPNSFTTTIESHNEHNNHLDGCCTIGGMAPATATITELKKQKKNPSLSYFHNLNDNNCTYQTTNTITSTMNDGSCKGMDCFELVRCIGSYGNECGQFKNPSDVAIDFTYQLIFISDTDNKRIQVFDESSLTFKYMFETPFKPNALTVHWDHTLIISFTRDSLICKYDFNGNEIWKWGGLSTKNVMDSPTGVVVDFEGNIYVCDWFKHRIIVFSPSGQLVRSIGSMGKNYGQFSFPRDIDMDGACNLIVSDSGNNRLQILKSNGEFITSIESLGLNMGEFQSPNSVLVDKSTGFIYLTEWDSHRISKFHPNNLFSGSTCIGGFGNDENSFKYPSGIALCYGSSRLLVVDCGNSQLKVYRVT